jgi:hypothetical protein
VVHDVYVNQTPLHFEGDVEGCGAQHSHCVLR